MMVAQSPVRPLSLAGICLRRIAILFAMAASAMAVPITYTFTSIGSGTIGSTPFTNALVTVTATGDTSAIFQGENPPFAPGTFINPVQLSVTIAGVGTANLTGSGDITGYGPLPNGYVYDNQSAPNLGFGLVTDNTTITDAAFSTYDLSSAIGPVSNVNISFSDEMTTLGALTLTTVTPGAFTATSYSGPTIGGVPINATLSFTQPTIAGTVLNTDSIPVEVTLSLAGGSASLTTDRSGNVAGLVAGDITPYLDPNRPMGSDATDATSSYISVFFTCGAPTNFVTDTCDGIPYGFNFNYNAPTLVNPTNFSLTAGNSFASVFGTFAPAGGTAPAGTYTFAAVGVTIQVLDGSSVLAEIPVACTVSTYAGDGPCTAAPQPYFVRNVVSLAQPVAPLTITTSPGSIATTVGGSVSASFSANGGTGPYTYSISGQPAGVILGSGSLSGTPTQAGNFNATVTVSDTNQASASASIAINVLGLTTTSLPTGTTGLSYATFIGAAGGAPAAGPIAEARRAIPADVGVTYLFSATGLPPGLFLTNYGYLNGTVYTAGTYPLSITVSSGGLSVTTTLNLTIAPPGPLSISGAALPGGTVNILYSQALGATGGLPPYTWSQNAGSLPAGLSLSASGIVSGTPVTPGSFSFGVQARDTAGAIATATASLTIQAAPLTITTTSLPSGMNGVDYPQQQLAGSGGVPPYTWAIGSGSSLPSGLALSSTGILNGVPTVMGMFSVGVTVTDHATSQGSATLPLTIRPSSDDLILTTGALTFALSSPATNPPASQVVGVQSTIASQPIAYTLSVNPAAPWLALANGTTTPDSIKASITPAALALSPGPYHTTIIATCTSSSCAGHTQTVSVNLTVTASPPQLLISTGLLSFATTNAALGPLSQPISIENAGGGTLGFSSIGCEATWCAVGPLPSGAGGGASLAGGVGAMIPVTVNPGSLTPGFYRTQVDIASSGGKGSVPVTLFISGNATMTLAPAGALFNQPAGSGPGNPNGSFLVSVNSSSPVTFSAAIVPIAGQPVPSWLVLRTSGGSASSTQPGTVSFSINPVASAALAPGAYYGEIQIASSALSNSPEDFEVVLNVSAANAPVDPDPEPGGLLFITTEAGGSALPPQTVTVYSGSISALTFQASAATADGISWLSVTPDTGSASATAPGVTTVSVDASKLTAGVYQGGVSYSLSATAVRTVNVTLIVSGSAGAASAVSSAKPKASGCTPSMLVPAQTALVNSFSQPAGWPTPLQIVLSDDCGSTVNNGQIVATFSNGDPPLALPLVNQSQGLYSGTWSPARASSQVAINVTANAPGFPAATSQIAGAVVPNAVPLLTPNSTLHSFDPLIGGALAPGTIVAVYGQNLAAATAQPTTIPLPTTFNGTSVIIGGMEAPLYYVSPTQINAQIPFELEPAIQYQVIVSANGALTTPQPIQLAPATPGLATFSDGTLIAQHGDGSLVSQTAPAMGGEYLVAYLAGLGQTTVPVSSGTASPSSPLAEPATTPTLTIDGTQYPILFAGLTPGLVGLYQMNFQVPAGLAAGNLTIIVSQNGQASNQTVLPYQP
jgi:uncharacterized protein (TIGR03437 family)